MPGEQIEVPTSTRRMQTWIHVRYCLVD